MHYEKTCFKNTYNIQTIGLEESGYEVNIMTP